MLPWTTIQNAAGFGVTSFIAAINLLQTIPAASRPMATEFMSIATRSRKTNASKSVIPVAPA